MGPPVSTEGGPLSKGGDRIMNKKWHFVLCSVIIIGSNLLMITAVNHGEEILSNLFAIGITIILCPGFLWAIRNKKTPFIRMESSALLLLAVISVMRLVNRIDPLPPIANGSIVLVAMGMGTIMIVVAIIRCKKK